ncbi:MAG: EF-hand domain-containing protein [Pseudomonadota bacterium]
MKYATALAVAALVAASAAFAGEKKADDKAMGCMAMDEAAMNAKMDAHFKAVDANADGKITEQELVEFVTAKAKKDFASMAGDDGAASFDEVKAHHHAMHEEMMKEHAGMDEDAHKDGHH